jgi:hypothetical protein
VNGRGDVPEVPVAWMCAQDGASWLLAQGGSCWPPASFEYGAVHDVLALTLLFTYRNTPLSEASRARIGVLRPLVTDDVEWVVWCQGRFDHGVPNLPRADKELAARRFRSLAASRLLGGSLDDVLDTCAVTATCRGAGVSVGVALARRVLDAQTHRCHTDH